MKNNLRISNIVFTGRMPFKRKLKVSEGNKLIYNLNWRWINEEVSPILVRKVKIRKNIKKSVHGKEKQPYVSIWCSGAINIVGVVSRKEANEVYDIVINDLKKSCKGVFK